MENHPNIEPESIKHRTRIDLKSTKITAGAKNVAHFVLGAVLEASWRRLGRVLGANIAPSWRPKSKENRQKIHAEIDRRIDAFQVPVLMQFCWIFGRKMEASWHQNRIKNRCYLENPEKHETNIKPKEFQ